MTISTLTNLGAYDAGILVADSDLSTHILLIL